MVVHVGTSSTANDFSFGKFKEVEVEVDTESEEEESDTKGNDTSDAKHDTSIGAIDVQEDDLESLIMTHLAVTWMIKLILKGEFNLGN
ncbi:hypothetical protein Tco_0474353 [Tanacetum coccineum]